MFEQEFHEGDIFKAGPYEFECKYYSRYMNTFTSLQPLPDNVKLYSSNGEPLARSGDVFFVTNMDDKIIIEIDNISVYKIHRHTSWTILEVPTPFN